MTESPFVDSVFAIPVFSPGDDLIACLNKAMAFLTAVASLSITVQQVQGRQGQNYFATTYKSNATSSKGNTASGHARVVKCYNYQGDGHMARQCTHPKRPRNAAWYKEKAMLAEVQEAKQMLDDEQLTFLVDPGIPASQAQTIIPHNAAFQTKDFDTYDSDCDDLSTVQAVLMANISNYGSEVISKIMRYLVIAIFHSQYLQETQQATVQDTNLPTQQDSMILSVIEQMLKQMINHVNNWEKADKEQNNESITAELERYKVRVKNFEQRLNIDLSCREKMIDSQMDDMIKEKLALKEKKAQRIKPTLSDGIVIYEKHVAMLVINDEEILILEEESRSKMSEKEKDPEDIKQNISHKPIDYEKLSRLTGDFRKHFTPQQELSTEQALWLRISNPTIESSSTPPVKLEVPSELPKNDLKAQLKDTDMTIYKLKDTIKYLRKNNKKEIVDYDRCDLATTNEELENNVAKLLYENERLCKEINHMK
nr:hypothetical protein [Tanacetum cinerariifolium]